MILKQLIRYENAPALEATWVRRDQMPDVEVPASPALYDKDGNEVQPAVEAHTRPGEVIETVLKCQAYSNHPEQMAMLRADLGADATEHEALIAEVAKTYVLPEPPAAAELRAQLLAALTNEYETRMQVIAAAYPPSERESWPVQTAEARALLADPAAATPWIDAACAARGIDRVELAGRIVAKDDTYRAVHGLLTGVRQRIEDEIDAAGADAAALAAIDVTAGWPPAPV